MRLCRQTISALAALAVLGLAANASALIITNPTAVYTLPGGGSCSVANIPSRGTGATVSCTGVNLSAHTNVYFGIKNNSSVNGASLDGTAPTSANAEVFDGTTSTGASTITYSAANSSTTSACAAGGCAVVVVTCGLFSRAISSTSSIHLTGRMSSVSLMLAGI